MIDIVITLAMIAALQVGSVTATEFVDRGKDLVKLVQKHGMLKSKRRMRRPNRIILHHTAGGTLGGAESTLIQRGLSYHYMIDKKGVVHEYVPANRKAFHAYGYNTGTVGISFVGGGKYGGVNGPQYDAVVSLMKILKSDYPSIKDFSGHKHADKRGWKIDPHFEGEPADGVDWGIDRDHMKGLEKDSGLKAVFLRGPYARK